MSDQASVPFSAGVRTPVIVLPSALRDALPEASLRLVLEHELVHLSRRDPLSHGLTLACGTLFSFHPTASWLLRELLVMREAAVDAQVAQRDLHAYADLLVQMASWVRFGRDFTHVSMDDTALSRRIALLTRPAGKASRASLRPLLLSSVGIVAVSLLAPSVLADPIPSLPGPMRGMSMRTGFGVGDGLDFPGTFDPLAVYQPEIDACYEQARGGRADLVIDAHATFEVGGDDFKVTSANVPTPESSAFQSCVEAHAIGHWTFPPPPGSPHHRRRRLAPKRAPAWFRCRSIASLSAAQLTFLDATLKSEPFTVDLASVTPLGHLDAFPVNGARSVTLAVNDAELSSS